MLAISNYYSLNSTNKLNFGSNSYDKFHKVSIAKDTKDVLVSADECLEAYNKGGMLIHIQDTNSTDEKATEFISNMITFSNRDKNGDKINLYDSLINFTDQGIVLEYTEVRNNLLGVPIEVKRLVLEDSSVIDKDLYDFSRKMEIHSPFCRQLKGEDYFTFSNYVQNKADKINIGDYTFLIGAPNAEIITNVIDNKGNIVGKLFDTYGSVLDVLISNIDMAKHYNEEGDVVENGACESDIFRLV